MIPHDGKTVRHPMMSVYIIYCAVVYSSAVGRVVARCYYTAHVAARYIERIVMCRFAFEVIPKSAMRRDMTWHSSVCKGCDAVHHVSCKQELEATEAAVAEMQNQMKRGSETREARGRTEGC